MRVWAFQRYPGPNGRMLLPQQVCDWVRSGLTRRLQEAGTTLVLCQALESKFALRESAGGARQWVACLPFRVGCHYRAHWCLQPQDAFILGLPSCSLLTSINLASLSLSHVTILWLLLEKTKPKTTYFGKPPSSESKTVGVTLEKPMAAAQLLHLQGNSPSASAPAPVHLTAKLKQARHHAVFKGPL